jgi:hypothetical protein
MDVENSQEVGQEPKFKKFKGNNAVESSREVGQEPKKFNGNDLWKMCLIHSSISFFLCRNCRNKFVKDKNKILSKPNGAAEVTIRMCKRCVNFGTDFGNNYIALNNDLQEDQ